MMNVIACPTRDFGPHDPSRNLGTANSRSKPCPTSDSGHHPRRSPEFGDNPQKTMSDYGPRLVK